MKKLFWALNAIIICLILVGDVCYTIFGSLWLKGLTSGLFVLLGVVNLIYLCKQKSSFVKFGVIMLVGLVLSMIADIVLNLGTLGFMIGAGIFAVGHVFYFFAYGVLKRFKWTDLIASAIIFLPSCLVICLVPIFDFGGILMQIICVVYALIISLMFGKAIANLIRERSLHNLLIVVGSFLFFFSDLMLLFANFATVSIVFDILCLATYYPAQCILANSILLAEEITKKDSV